jgi:preprotein translocase subunit SecA
LLKERVEKVFGITPPFEEWVKEEAVEPEMFVERLQKLADDQMEAKSADIPPETWIQIEKSYMLQFLDHHWKEHLSMLDALRRSCTCAPTPSASRSTNISTRRSRCSSGCWR